jgi:hypothetical protein
MELHTALQAREVPVDQVAVLADIWQVVAAVLAVQDHQAGPELMPLAAQQLQVKVMLAAMENMDLETAEPLPEEPGYLVQLAAYPQLEQVAVAVAIIPATVVAQAAAAQEAAGKELPIMAVMLVLQLVVVAVVADTPEHFMVEQVLLESL